MSYTSNDMLNELFGSQTRPSVVLRDFSGLQVRVAGKHARYLNVGGAGKRVVDLRRRTRRVKE